MINILTIKAAHLTCTSTQDDVLPIWKGNTCETKTLCCHWFCFHLHNLLASHLAVQCILLHGVLWSANKKYYNDIHSLNISPVEEWRSVETLPQCQASRYMSQQSLPCTQQELLLLCKWCEKNYLHKGRGSSLEENVILDEEEKTCPWHPQEIRHFLAKEGEWPKQEPAKLKMLKLCFTVKNEMEDTENRVHFLPWAWYFHRNYTTYICKNKLSYLSYENNGLVPHCMCIPYVCLDHLWEVCRKKIWKKSSLLPPSPLRTPPTRLVFFTKNINFWRVFWLWKPI